MKILVTGAHFTTAVAVIEELQKTPNLEIVYVGRKTTREGDFAFSPESEIIPKMGVKFIPIITGRLQRSFTVYTIPSLLKIPIGFLQSFWIIFQEKPDIILSFGGYVSVPVVIVSWLFSIPIVIHEQTLVTGLANKIASIFATKILISFNIKNNFDTNKVFLTGNPIRKEIMEKSEASEDIKTFFKEAHDKKLPVILVTGGNQGSHVINQTIENSLADLIKKAAIIHLTGDSNFKDFERLELKQGKQYLVRKFIYEDMPFILKNTDLVISRAGINTLTELAYLGIPGLVIPIDYLNSDEQNKNAKFFEDLGLVKILSQKKLSAKSLMEQVNGILKNLDQIKINAKQAKKVVNINAAKQIALQALTSKGQNG